MKYTPGPWNIGYYSEPHEIVSNWPSIVVKGKTIAQLDQDYFQNGLSFEETKANANLIASAPDLLKVLKRMNKMYMILLKQCNGIDDSIAFDVRKAIKKACGDNCE